MTDHAGLKKQAERLLNRVKAYNAGHGNFYNYGPGDSQVDQEAAAAILALLAENERLKGVLRPFAAIGEKLFNMIPDQAELYLAVSGDPESAITAGDLRAARAALGEK